MVGRGDGVLTFVFTDIDGHSALWDANPAAMSIALRDHDALLKRAVLDAGGSVVKSAGDGVMAVFADPAAAVDAVGAAQAVFVEREWDGIGKLRLRVGLHVGVAEERDGDYFGTTVIRAARLCDAAHGGQVVASRAVAELVTAAIWNDLGSHRLRGLADPIDVMQLGGDEFPPLRTVEAGLSTLPSYRTAFFGRGADVERVAGLVGEHRLVTLTGVGGTGKTRLAVEAAEAVRATFTDGVAFVDLSSVTDGDATWEAAARGLRLDTAAPDGSASTASLVTRFLEQRQVLLVVDNCEHLLDDAADLIEELLGCCDGIAVLATSRENLQVDGEHVVAVGSLALDGGAVALFIDRAAAVGVSDVDVKLVEEVCRRLDGIPLAIELAAARSGQLGVDGVAAGLDDRFRLLTGGRRRVARQQTLEATLDWSYDLLDPDQQATLRCLSVFVGGFSMSAAQHVAATSPDVLADLVAKSLVERNGHRFHLLETVRTYTAEQLHREGDAANVRDRHVNWMIEHLGDGDPLDIWFRPGHFRDLVGPDLDNAAAALDWAISSRRWPDVVRLGTVLTPIAATLTDTAYWWVPDRLDEALDLIAPGPDRGQLLTLRLLTKHTTMDPQLRDEAIEAASDARLRAIAICLRANHLDANSRLAGDEAGVEEAARLVEYANSVAGDDDLARSMAVSMRAILAMNRADWRSAVECFDDVIRLRQRAGAPPMNYFDALAYGPARRGAGQPWRFADAAALSIDFHGLPATPEFWLAAITSPGANRPTRPFEVDPHELERHAAVIQTMFVIYVARLAADEADLATASRLMAAARSVGGLFTSPPGYAAYRVLLDEIRPLLTETERRRLITQGESLGLRGGTELACAWLVTTT